MVSKGYDYILIDTPPLNIVTDALVIPEDLAEGEYTLQIETYYAAGNKLLKEPRVLVYSKPITIS